MPNSSRITRVLGLGLFLALSCPLQATNYYIDSELGSNFNSGTSPWEAWKSPFRVRFKEFEPGDKLFLRSGDRWTGTLKISGEGEAEFPIEVSAYGEENRPWIGGLDVEGEYILVQDLIIDADQDNRDAVRIEHSKHITLRRLEIRNGKADGIDIQNSQDILLSELLIHHFLAGSFENQLDAHGVGASNTQRLTIEFTEIHHTSGDSLQVDADRNAEKMSNDIIIRDSHFWTSPLEKDFNSGWRATAHKSAEERQYPGENAIDTKVVKENWEAAPRMRLTIDNLRAHGWRADAYIANKAIFNLKEKIDATLNNIEVFDCEIAFRLRGKKGDPFIRIHNSKIYDCKVGIRAEDGLEDLTVTHTFFGEGLKMSINEVGKNTRRATKGWTFTNNLFHKKVPVRQRNDSNRSLRDLRN